MSEDSNGSVNENLEAYLELESTPCEGGPSIEIEFPISLKVFVIAYAISLSEKCNS